MPLSVFFFYNTLRTRRCVCNSKNQFPPVWRRLRNPRRSVYESMINRFVNGNVPCFLRTALTHPWRSFGAFTSIFRKRNNRNSSFAFDLENFYGEILRRIRSSRLKAAPVDMQLHRVACNTDCISASRAGIFC